MKAVVIFSWYCRGQCVGGFFFLLIIFSCCLYYLSVCVCDTEPPFDPWPLVLRSGSAERDHEDHRNTHSGVHIKTRVWGCECRRHASWFIVGSFLGIERTNTHRVQLWLLWFEALFILIMTSSLRLKATSKVFRKWRRKTSARCFPQLIHKVRHARAFFLSHLFQFGSQTVIWRPVRTLSSAVSVLQRMLLLDPENRVSAAEGLTMPYFKDYRDPEGEKEAEPYDHSVDNSDLTLSQWKRKDGGEEELRQRSVEGRRPAGTGGRRSEQFYWSLSCCALLFFSRSHLHRDPDLQTRCDRSQGNLAVRHDDSTVQPGDQNKPTPLFFFIILIWTEITELSRSNSRFSHKYQAGSCFWSFLPDSSMLQLSCCTSGNNILWWVTQSSGSCGWYYMS